MKKYLRYTLIAIVLILSIFFTINKYNSIKNSSDSKITTSTNIDNKTNLENFKLNDLKNTNNFNNHALEHIFYGSINKNGEATGYHYEGLTNNAKIIESTITKADKNGIYRAKVQIKGISKQATSSFFPKYWTPQEVVDSINEAYKNKKNISSNIYEGQSKSVTIQMYLTEDKKIISAFPIYQK